MNIKKSIELYARAEKLMPGGVNSPVRAFRSVGGTPLFIDRGQGPFIYDVDGNRYVDFCMSWGPLILGHADPDVVKSIADTAVKGTSFGAPCGLEVDIAAMVIGRFPSIEKIRFVNSGTEAVMSAVRLARGFTGRDKIIKFDGCYHGHADHMLVAAGSGLATLGVPDSAGVTRGAAGDTIVSPFNDLKALEEIFIKEKGAVAAVILEPLPCNYAMIPPAEGFLQGVRSLCSENGALLIFDEVITGLRLSRGGAQEYYGIRADLTTLGKVIGGGLPVGAYGGRADMMAKISPDGPVYQAGTLSGNPIAMAAGIAAMKKLDAVDGYKVLAERAGAFYSMMRPHLERHRGRVLMLMTESIFCFYFTSSAAIGSLADVKSGDMKLYASFHREMLQRGVYLAPSGYEVGFLSTAHGIAELEFAARMAGEALDVVLDNNE